MPVLNAAKRRLVEYLASLINELHIGSDGTVATDSDGGVRSLGVITPTVRILDDSSVSIEGFFDATYIFAQDVQEVYLQYRDASTGEFIPVYRVSIPPITKNGQNEIHFSFILEVD